MLTSVPVLAISDGKNKFEIWSDVCVVMDGLSQRMVSVLVLRLMAKEH